MGSNHKKRYIMRWIVPGIILAFLMILMLAYFSVKGRQGEKTDFNKKLITQVEISADKFSDVIKGIQVSAGTIANLLHQQEQLGNDYSFMMKSIMEETGVYNAVICNDNGTAYLYDGSTKKIDHTDYYQKAVSDNIYITFTKDNGIDGREGIVIMTPISDENNSEQYIICYYDPSEFGSLVRRREFGSSSFCLLLDTDGTTIAKDFVGTSNFYREDSYDFFDLLKEDEANQKTVQGLWIHAVNGDTGMGYYTIAGEERAILVSSVADSKFYFVVGVESEFIEKKVDAQWEQNADMLMQIMVTLFIFIGLVIINNIISKVKENENSRKLVDIANTDELTDLLNKAATEREIKQYIAEHPDEKGLMLVLDIDNFKKINDTMGHAFGDEVLHTFGIRLRAQFRVNDIVGRTGGDEFTVYVHDIKSREAIKHQADRIEGFFQNFQAGEYVKYSATASIGAAVYPDDANDFEGLYKAADQALYVAKKRGKNQLAFYGDENV